MLNINLDIMPMLQLPSSGPANLQIQERLSNPKLGIFFRRKCLSNSFSSSPSLFMSNSQQPQYPISLSPPINQSVAAIVFGDGSESRLYPLTKRRSEGAIPIAANYRLIDTVISNCINSNINKIYAITQFNSTSLNSHLSKAYNSLGLGKQGFVEVIAAHQTPQGQGWFQGSGDAIRRCLWVMEEFPVSEYLIIPGHHLYKMDYQKLVQIHRTTQADITIAALDYVREADPGFGLLTVNSQNQVVEFILNPEEETVKSPRKLDSSTYSKFSSMGIYLVNKDVMTELLYNYFPDKNDFGAEVVPAAISSGMQVQAYVFDGYWEDLRSISAFYKANMENIKTSNMGFNFYDREFPLYTMPRCLPPTSINHAEITDSVIGDGCMLNRCKIKGSIVGMRTSIGDRAVIEDSVIMGSDIYQKDCSKKDEIDIPIGIGDDTHTRKAIIDVNARIGRNVMIINKDNVQESNREANGYIISEGIVVILQDALILDGTIL